MQSSRYQDRPVYFSDIIVNAESGLKTFDELVGKTLCYNDPGSNSGYNLVHQRLMQSKHPSSFFLARLSNQARIKVPSDWLLKDWLTVRRLTAPC